MTGLFPLWHLAHLADWRAAQPVGEYRISTRGRTLDEEGFIHCSQTDTFRAVTPLFRNQMEPLVLLVIDTDKLKAPLKWEGEPVKYPHIYAAFNRDAVTDVLPYRKNRDGEWIVNDELL